MKLEFFKINDYLRSWSTWVLGAFVGGPILDHFTGIISALVPVQYQPLVISILGTIGLILRAIKQRNTK